MEDKPANSEKDKYTGELLLVGGIALAVLGVVRAIFLPHIPLIHPALGILTTALWASAIVPLTRSLTNWWREKKARRERVRQETEDAVREAEREKLVARLQELIGDDAISRGFLAAVERLTEYVPEQGNMLIEALLTDTERYQMLGTLMASSENVMLIERSKRERGAIEASARKIASELTEVALETIKEFQESETGQVLGDEYKPRLDDAASDFRHYLAGLREIRSTPKETQLQRDIEALASPPEVRALPLARVKG